MNCTKGGLETVSRETAHAQIPADAIAIVTPHGRYERVLRSRKKVLPCGHRTAMDEIAWQRDAKTQSAELPALVCNRCMKGRMEALVAGGHKAAA